MTHTYTTKGVCAKSITIEVDDNNIITNISFLGGCSGNLSGISKLCIGKDINEVASLLKGTTCGSKSTSCPDQLAIALEGIAR